MRGVKCITFVLWIDILNVITGENNSKLVLTPLHPVIHVGEDLEMTCQVFDCPVNVTFMWTSAMDRFLAAELKNEHTVSYLLIRSISVIHSETVMCKTTCDGKILQKMTKIEVFSFPEDPVLPRIKSLIANQEQKLICTVHNIYPLERFHIEWLRGDKTLHKEELDLQNSDHVQNYTSVFNYTPSVDDLGKNISCKATLNLNGLERTTTAEYGPGTMTVSSNNTSVKLGEHLEITCHADGNPKPKIFWWKLGETEPEHQSQNNKLIISKACWSQAGWYRCGASNNVGSQQMSVKVIVTGPPNIPKIQLSHRGELKEGENITIFCSSDGGPAELKLYRQSQSVATGDPNESAVLLNISSIQITDAGIYICEAKNDFGIERSTMNITVKAQHGISRNSDLPVAILPAVGSVSLLTAAGLLIRHCRRKARSDSSTLG
ncbi:vascular cell adhesion protein 1-like [Sinocyclocheilus anshuiensis]|uniref:vascular cell adhesion protein 1-like n=1 Tax=Sinocyclocheilus anshuiensis TaxID=1608454 RepID=UPI0007B807D2|nr:PREDICTED: vascular cell adhesion protein 1-like [Sinocyclocheilus anshuiensis]